MALGSAIYYSGDQLDIGALREPGFGFMLFWLGIILIGLSLCTFTPALRSKGSKGN